MKRLKVEHTAFDFQDYCPRKSFFDDLSLQLTPRILDAITVEDIRNNATKVVCLSIDTNSYLSPHFHNGINSMQMNVAAYSTSLILCKIEVFWQDRNGNQIFPWNDIDWETQFDVRILDSERKKLNHLLPRIYHPVIKPEISGLPYAYQIFYGGESLNLYYVEKLYPDKLSEVRNIAESFFKNWNEANDHKINCIELKQHSDTQITIRVDFGGCCNAVEALIRSFKMQNGIKKIILR